MLIYSIKARQTTDLQNVTKLSELVNRFLGACYNQHVVDLDGIDQVDV
jgi:hypothetical protein